MADTQTNSKKRSVDNVEVSSRTKKLKEKETNDKYSHLDWQMSSICGSLHQGNRVFSEQSIGRQCVANSIESLIVAQDILPEDWDTATVNDILFKGDTLYRKITEGTEIEYLLPTDIPKRLFRDGVEYIVAIGDEFCGNIHTATDISESLTDSMRIAITDDLFTSWLLCLANSSSLEGSTISLMSYGRFIAAFDPHSRNRQGMPDSNGTAVLQIANNIEQMLQYLLSLASALGCDTYTLTQVRIINAAENISSPSRSLDSTNSECMESTVNETTRKKKNKGNRREQKARKRMREKLSQQERRKEKGAWMMIRENEEKRKKRAEQHRQCQQQYRNRQSVKEREKQKNIDKERKRESQKLETPDEHEQRKLKSKTYMSKKRITEKSDNTTEAAISAFHKHIKQTPIYICTSCHRLLWRRSVRLFHIENYNEVPLLRDTVFQPKFCKESVTGKTYICITCHTTILKGKLPAQSKANGLELDIVPTQLSILNELEVPLISLQVLFIQVRTLPKGGQKGMKGPAVNVPADLSPICTLLPRLPSNAQLITMKFKRKLAYNKHYMMNKVHPDRVIDGLMCLKDINYHYKDVQVHPDWLSEWEADDEEIYEWLFGACANDMEIDDHSQQTTGRQTDASVQTQVTSEQISGTSSNTNEASGNRDADETQKQRQDREDREDEIAFEESSRLRGLPYNTLFQNEGREDADRIFSIAPCEGKKPKPLLTDPFMEELCHPDKYPTGKGGFHYTRKVPITLKKYINVRLLDCDGRFARDVNYVLGMQYATDHKQVRDSATIAVRKTRQSQIQDLTAGRLREVGTINSLIAQDAAYSFLQKVRGSPPYWQVMFLESLAVIRTFGIPTFFLTLSAADLQWPEVIQAIAAQYGVSLTEEEVRELPWEKRCDYIRRNPITAARMFEHRVNAFMTVFLNHKARPLGIIVEFIIRVEFQARGSPHIHSMLWIKGAPKLDVDDDQVVIDFIDKHISCSLPQDDDELLQLVQQLQVHSHSASCRRKQDCRFNFPRPPSDTTLISKPPDDKVELQLATASTIASAVRDVLKTTEISSETTLDEVLQKAKVPTDTYHKALGTSRRGKTVILRRKPGEQNVNCYSPCILKAWRANMDIQYIVNAYACLQYVASYVMKAEKGMSEILKNAVKEIDRHPVQEPLKQLQDVFLRNREVSEQEAAVRALSMMLRKFSSRTIFINTNEKKDRIGLLKSKKQLEQLDEDDDDVYCSNMIDRYTHRPMSVEHLCLADFMSLYTYYYSTSKNSTEDENDDLIGNTMNVHDVDNTTDDVNFDEFRAQLPKTIKIQKTGLGTLRKKSKPSVIRWHSFNRDKQPEKYFRSLLMLFMPWRNEDNLNGQYDTHEERYAAEKEALRPVEARYIYKQRQLEEAYDKLQTSGPPQNAWDDLAPGAEESAAEAETEGITDERLIDEDDIVESLNDQQSQKKNSTRHDDIISKYRSEASKEILSVAQYNKCMRSLNPQQKEVVMYHREWCKQTVANLKQNRPVRPYCLFLSGPGGVGKSYVIKMIHTDTIRYARNIEQIEPDKLSILLTASTGVAAFNINGLTIHSALVFNERFKNKRSTATYDSMSDELCETLHNHLSNMLVLIIDEISMLGAEMLFKVHRRLEEIMHLEGSNTRFGNVTIIAVGDLYQLPPVGGRKIFQTPGSRGNNPDPIVLHGSLWKENFFFHELTTVVRQSNLQFATTLNNVRRSTLTDEDRALLQSRCIDRHSPQRVRDALHVFGTNKETDYHNNEMLRTLQTQKYTITSRDTRKDRETQLLNMNVKDRKRSETGGLPTELTIAEGAYVKMVANIDVTDGLVNGARGVIQKIITSEGTNKVQVVLVKFEGSSGAKAKRASPYRREWPHAVPVSKHVTPFTIGNVTYCRAQFPLVPAWASTIHSVQGLTVDQIVVDMTKIFQPGQVYVALSRVRTLEGLQIINYKESAIKTDPLIHSEMERLRTKSIQVPPPLVCVTAPDVCLKICHLNTNGYLNHLHDIRQHEVIKSCDLICLTESHMKKEYRLGRNSLAKDNAWVLRCDRTYASKGGILIFADKKIKPEEIVLNMPAFECAAVKIEPRPNWTVHVLSMYRRAQQVPCLKFAQYIQQTLTKLNLLNNCDVVLVGDFNEDTTGYIATQIKDLGFMQLINEPTTDYGSTLDHIYIKMSSEASSTLKQPIVQVVNAYFSDHDFTTIMFSHC